MNRFPSTANGWRQLPASYRMLAYYFSVRGYDVNPNMPGDDRPESADRVLAEAFEWLNSENTAAPPAPMKGNRS